MKTNPNFVLRKIAGENVLLPTGIATQKYNGLITLNSTAVFIWENINISKNKDELVDKVVEHFEIDKKTANEDVEGLLKEFLEKEMIFE